MGMRDLPSGWTADRFLEFGNKLKKYLRKGRRVAYEVDSAFQNHSWEVAWETLNNSRFDYNDGEKIDKLRNQAHELEFFVIFNGGGHPGDILTINGGPYASVVESNAHTLAAEWVSQVCATIDELLAVYSSDGQALLKELSQIQHANDIIQMMLKRERAFVIGNLGSFPDGSPPDTNGQSAKKTRHKWDATTMRAAEEFKKQRKVEEKLTLV